MVAKGNGPKFLPRGWASRPSGKSGFTPEWQKAQAMARGFVGISIQDRAPAPLFSTGASADQQAQLLAELEPQYSGEAIQIQTAHRGILHRGKTQMPPAKPTTQRNAQTGTGSYNWKTACSRVLMADFATAAMQHRPGDCTIELWAICGNGSIGDPMRPPTNFWAHTRWLGRHSYEFVLPR